MRITLESGIPDSNVQKNINAHAELTRTTHYILANIFGSKEIIDKRLEDKIIKIMWGLTVILLSTGLLGLSIGTPMQINPYYPYQQYPMGSNSRGSDSDLELPSTFEEPSSPPPPKPFQFGWPYYNPGTYSAPPPSPPTPPPVTMAQPQQPSFSTPFMPHGIHGGNYHGPMFPGGGGLGGSPSTPIPIPTMPSPPSVLLNLDDYPEYTSGVVLPPAPQWWSNPEWMTDEEFDQFLDQINQPATGSEPESETDIPVVPHEYNFTYFDARGRGEGIRLILAAADVKYTDTRVDPMDWADLKATTGYGKLPILEVDGKQLTQSLAIARYLGTQYGFEPKDPFMAAQVEEVGGILNDAFGEEAWDAYVGSILSEDEEDRAEAVIKLVDEVFPTYLRTLNALVSATPGTFIGGEKESWGDFLLANALDLIYNVSPIPPRKFIPVYPRLQNLRREIFARPGVKEYIESRPEAKF